MIGEQGINSPNKKYETNLKLHIKLKTKSESICVIARDFEPCHLTSPNIDYDKCSDTNLVI